MTYLSFPHDEPNGQIRIYSKNLRFDNDAVLAIHEDIDDADVDVVMLQEVSGLNDNLLNLLKVSFPHQHICKTGDRGDVAIASKHAFERVPLCSQSRAIVVAAISFDQSQIWVGSVHAPWPWPMATDIAQQDMWNILSSLDGPVVFAGDFNTLPWSARLKQVMTLTNTRVAGPVRPSLNHAKLPIPLPLDYALAPAGGSVALRPLLGSDHAGLVADLILNTD